MNALTTRNMGCSPRFVAGGGATEDTVATPVIRWGRAAAQASAWGPPPEVADEPEPSEIESIGQLLDIARPVEEVPTRLVGRTAEPRPLRADEANTGRNCGGFQKAAGESGVVAAVEEHDGPSYFEAEFSAAEPSAIESRHLHSFSVDHSALIPVGSSTWVSRTTQVQRAGPKRGAARRFSSLVRDGA